MKKSMRELLERSFQGDKVIAYIDSIEADNMLLTKERDALANEFEKKHELNQKLQKQNDKLASKIVELSDYAYCKIVCPVGKAFCPCEDECKDKEVWKEWAKKNEG